LKWFQKELYIPTEVIDRSPLETWQKKAQADGVHPETAFQRASHRVETLLTYYRPNRLADNVRAELHRITELEARKYGMDCLPQITSNL
jgi:trimethylamine:corrinoid methyltransferase-like protein